jgi:hypothetical protein
MGFRFGEGAWNPKLRKGNSRWHDKYLDEDEALQFLI